MPFDPRGLLNGQAATLQGLQAEEVPVPEWGDEADGWCWLSQLTADERDQLEEEWQEHRQAESVVGFRAFVVAWCMADKDNRRAFQNTTERVQAAAALGAISSRPVVRLFNVACRMNGLLASDVEELEKNYDPPPVDSGSGG